MRKSTDNQKRLSVLMTAILALSTFLTAFPIPTQAAVQNAYRWRNDNGSETTATYAAAENTPLSNVDKNSPFRLRMGAANSDNESAYSVANTLTLASGENTIVSSAIDTAGGFAYFGLTTGAVVKYDLSNDTEVGSPLSPANSPRNLVIDPAGGFLYSITGGGISKIRLSDFTQVANTAITVSVQAAIPTSVIDTTNGFIYIGAGNGNTGKVSKVSLSSFTETAVLSTSAGNNFGSAAIDVSGGFAYFETFTSPAHIVKVDLSSFTESASLDLNSGNVPGGVQQGGGFAFVIDNSGGTHYAYSSSYVASSKITKIDLSTFTVPVAPLATSGSFFNSAVIDTAAGYAYFGSTFNASGFISKIKLSNFTENDVLSTGNNYFQAAVINTATGYAYFGTASSPGKVYKIALVTRPSLQIEYSRTDSTCAGASSWTAVGIPAGSEDWVMSPSGNIADGAATTDSSGLSNGATTFVAGEIHDTTSITAPITLTNDHFTEVEYSIKATTNAAAGAIYCFRLTDAGITSGFTYTNYAQATLVGPTQTGYLWRNDNGSESAATSATTQNTALSVVKGTTERLRLGMDGPYDGAATVEYGLKTSTCASIMNWTAVGSSGGTEDWTMSNSSNLTDGQATTNDADLTDGSGTFTAGQAMDVSTQTSSFSLTGSQYTELEFSIKANATDPDGGSYCFRLNDPTTNNVFAYTHYAEATLTGPTQNAYRWRNDDGSESTASYAKPENTALTVATETPERLRLGLTGPSGSSGGIVTAKTAQIDANSSGASGIAVTPDSAHAYVGDYFSNTVSVIRTSDNAVIATVTVGNSPAGIAVTPDGAHVYVANLSDSTVSVIRTSDNTVVGSPINVGNDPEGIAVAPDGAHVYVFNENDATVSVIQTSDNTVVGSPISVGNPHTDTFDNIAVSPDSAHVYTANASDSTISVIRVSDDHVDTIDTGLSPTVIRVAPDGAHVYATNYYDSSVTVIQASNNAIVDTVSVGTRPRGIDVSPDSARVYTTSENGNTVSVIRTSDDVVTSTIGGMNGPEGIAIASDGAHAYVANQSDNTVSVITIIGSNGGERLEYGVKTSTCGAISSWTQVGTSAGSQDWIMSDSANLTDGEATTDSSGLSNGAATFKAGQAKDVTSQTSAITFDATHFTEVEYSIKANSTVASGTAYCFRLTGAGNSFGYTYAQYAQATVSSGGESGTPTVTSVTHNPTQAETGEHIILQGTATDPGGIRRIELYLDGTDAGHLVKTCDFSPYQSPATCQYDAGLLTAGSHTTTAKAYNNFNNSSTGSDTFTVSNVSSASRFELSDYKKGVISTFTLTFAQTGTSDASSTLIVTFPSGFTVDTAATSGSGCLSNFGHTNSTMTAHVASCSGTVVMTGGTVTNPLTTGTYILTFSDDTGSGAVTIVDDDTFNISASVDPTITFNVGTQTAACDGTFSGSGGTLGLGTLDLSSVTTSDVNSVPHVCTRLSTNASGGAVVTVSSTNTALVSTSHPGDTIPSTTATLTAGTTGYGLCVGSGGSDTGKDTTTPAGASPTRVSPFNGACTTSSHAVGSLTVAPRTLWSISGPSQNAFARIYIKAAISSAVASRNDYADLLTFVVTGTY